MNRITSCWNRIAGSSGKAPPPYCGLKLDKSKIGMLPLRGGAPGRGRGGRGSPFAPSPFGAPDGPFYHQWIYSITVNGKLLLMDRTASSYPKHAQTPDVPCEVAEGEGSKVIIQFCTNEQSTDPGKSRENFVNIQNMRDTFQICKKEVNVSYYPQSNDNVLKSTTCTDSKSLCVTLTAPRFTAGMVHSIYTVGLGGGHVNGSPNDAIAFRSCFRNPDCWSFCVEATDTPRHELANDFKAVLDSGLLSDVLILVEGERIEAHSVILAARSKVFSAMFTSPMQESSEKTVNVVDVPASAMKTLLLFIYCGEVPRSVLADAHACLNLLRAAHRYDITSLVIMCSESLGDAINVQTVCNCFCTAETLNLERLRTKCFEFMTANIADIQNESSYVQLTDQKPSLLRELMTALHPPRKRKANSIA